MRRQKNSGGIFVPEINFYSFIYLGGTVQMRKEKKMARKMISLLICLVLLSIPMVSIAMDQDVDQDLIVEGNSGDRHQYIDSINISLSRSGSVLYPKTKVVDSNGDSTKLYCCMYLQKKVNGSWSNVAYWTKTTTSQILTLTASKSVARGTYRVKSLVVAYSGSTAESVTKYSGTLTY